jgi:hypothetical protein
MSDIQSMSDFKMNMPCSSSDILQAGLFLGQSFSCPVKLNEFWQFKSRSNPSTCTFPSLIGECQSHRHNHKNIHIMGQIVAHVDIAVL